MTPDYSPFDPQRQAHTCGSEWLSDDYAYCPRCGTKLRRP